MKFKETLSDYFPRHAERMLRTALAESRIVALVGPRQSGKTTLARRLSAGTGRSFVNLDDRHQRQFVMEDQAGFMRTHQLAAIDEIQRVPDLVLALKKSVDEDPRPGRYLITGSVDFFNSVMSPDSLAGRLTTIELFPFSQAEILKTPAPDFLRRAFAADFPALAEVGACEDLNERVLAGGYPAALARSDRRARHRWLRDCVQDIVRRDAPTAGPLQNRDALAGLLDHAAATAAGLVNLSGLSTRLMVSYNTIDRWLTLLERMFLLRRIRAWHRNRTKRMIKAPKLHFVDSGMLAALRRVNAKALRDRRHELGPLLESFVFSEVLKAMAHWEDSLQLSHYRDKGGNEVDFVLEDFAGTTIGLEVKAAVDVYPNDFRGLRHLQKDIGARFACGIILHDGSRIIQFEDRMFAMPVGMLWEG